MNDLHPEWVKQGWLADLTWPPLGSSELKKPGDARPNWLERVQKSVPKGGPLKTPTPAKGNPEEAWQGSTGDSFPDQEKREALTDLGVKKQGNAIWPPPEARRAHLSSEQGSAERGRTATTAGLCGLGSRHDRLGSGSGWARNLATTRV